LSEREKVFVVAATIGRIRTIANFVKVYRSAQRFGATTIVVSRELGVPRRKSEISTHRVRVRI
jgi:hypothetical protein